MHKIHTIRGCDCADINLCVVRALHFMPCHRLMLVQLPERIAFYCISDLYFIEEKNSVPCDLAEYETRVAGPSAAVSNIYIDNNTHTAVRYGQASILFNHSIHLIVSIICTYYLLFVDSVYNNHVVAQETTRVLILFKVLEANHSTRSVVVESIRRIFLPLWSCTVLMMEDKVDCNNFEL